MLGQCLCLITYSVTGYVLVCRSWSCSIGTILSSPKKVVSQPPTNRSDLKNTQDYWLLTRQRYLAVRRGEDLPRHKKHRVAGTLPHFYSLISFFSYHSSILLNFQIKLDFIYF